MFEALKRWWGEGQEGVGASPTETASFLLQFGELEIGYLDLRQGVWKFRYTPAFVEQLSRPDAVHPLIDFPDPKKVYESSALWPFFMARIPSSSQPKVQEEIERKGLDQSSAAQLLKAFGERSIANPFLLRPAA